VYFQKIASDTIFLIFLICLFFSTFQSCKNGLNDSLENDQSTSSEKIITNNLVAKGAWVDLGKTYQSKFDSIFKKNILDTFQLPNIDVELATGLHHQLRLLKYQKKKSKQINGIELNKQTLEETVKVLLSAQFDNDFGLKNKLDAHQIWGQDQRGNVKYTGYFTPEFKVRKKKNSIYKYPLYAYPKTWTGKLPSRQQIEEEGVLDSLNLEICYSKNKLDIYFMQVQGSGYVQYQNGTRELLSYAGTNQHSYKSIGKFMVENNYTSADSVSLTSIKSFFRKNPNLVDSILFANPSYVFFNPQSSDPIGAGNVPLTPNYSIAVDKKIIPLGSCLLGTVPVLDKDRNFSHHEYRILLAQDVGGAIKGTGHIDLYTGIGSHSEKQASNLHHYGKLWLLLPKDTTHLSLLE